MTLPTRYRVEREVGHTMFARDQQDDRDVVIKELTLGRITDWKELELFEREARTLRHLDHAAIPSLLADFRGESGDPTYYVVYERLSGDSLLQRIGAVDLIDEADLIAIARGVLDVLVYLQSFSPPIVHRNITPGAILIDGDAVQLIDFGSVQVELQATVGGSTVVGTSGYMAPEQLLGRAVPASDLYALGAVLVHVITGVEPADLPIERMALQWRDRARFGVARLHDWVDRLVQPDPRERFATAAEALRALGDDAVLFGDAALILATRPAGSPIELSRQARRLELKIPVRWLNLPRVVAVLLFVTVSSIALINFPAYSWAILIAMLVFGSLNMLNVMPSTPLRPRAPRGHLVLDVDRGYRLRGPEGPLVAGSFADVDGVETGFRGRRDTIWLATADGMAQIGGGLSQAERDWLIGEITSFMREQSAEPERSDRW